MFRNLFEGGVRDHAVMTFADPATPGEVRRVSNDDWQISACPHHGPSLSISPAGTYHVAWYTNGKARKGLFYARSQDEGRMFSDPIPLGRSDRNPTRPYVLAGPRGATMAFPVNRSRTVQPSPRAFSISGSATMRASWPLLTNAYVTSPFTATKAFETKVQGVVVQTRSEAPGDSGVPDQGPDVSGNRT